MAETNLSALAGRLKRVGHFKSFADEDLSTITCSGTIRTFPAGTVIFAEGEPGAGMFVLLSGHVHLCKLGPQGQQNLLAEIAPVIMFNEVSVLDGGTNLATAIAVEDCVTWNILFDKFHELVQRYPQVGLALLRVLATRTRMLLSQYEDLSFRSVLARTAKLLLDLSKYGQCPIDRRQHSNNEMAARIATVPEALSRSLKTFKANGDIVCTRSSITVQAPATLARLAQIDPALFKG